MDIIHILVFAGFAVPFMWLVPPEWRTQGLLVGSVLAVAWLIGEGGTDSPVFLLLLATILLTVAVWWMVRPVKPLSPPKPDDWRAMGIMVVLLIVIGIGYVAFSDTQMTVNALVSALLIAGVGSTSVYRYLIHEPAQDKTGRDRPKTIALWLIILILVILVVIKFPPVAQFVGYQFTWGAESLRRTSPFVWLGFSYIAFRLIAVLLDYRAGRLRQDDYSLSEFVTYVLFFPAFTAGPIDRAQHFIPQLQKSAVLDAPRLVESGTRIAVGIFKKFVIADSLALIAMSPDVIARVDSTPGYWLILYLYTFQIFFDFSGYSDVAIGLGHLYGITLPENFNRPYLQANIQQFWQRWHMTLSNWFRVYYFTPLSRFFIKSKINLPQDVYILFAQISTMILIGLWHGLTINFLLWGLWHGLGLFGHRLLADNTRNWTKWVNARPRARKLMLGGSVLFTFHFVALGWVFFALPEPSDSLNMLRGLFGAGG